MTTTSAPTDLGFTYRANARGIVEIRATAAEWLPSVAMLLALFSILLMNAVAAQPKALSRGEVAFRAHCIGCHSIGCNRNGPKLQDIFGRKAGSIADFKYTTQLKESGIVWSEETLDALLRDPGRLVPGTVMASVVRVQSAEERREIIKYLRRQDRSIDLCF